MRTIDFRDACEFDPAHSFAVLHAVLILPSIVDRRASQHAISRSNLG